MRYVFLIFMIGLLVGMIFGTHLRDSVYSDYLGSDMPSLIKQVEECEKPLPRTEKCVVIVEVKPDSASKEM